MNEKVVVLDFETTGLSPDRGDRATEIGAVVLEQGEVVDRFQSLMNAGIGDKKTREDHRALANQMYATYAEGKDLRGLVAMVGKEALSERDRKFLSFADDFESEFIKQDRYEDRSIEKSLAIGWKLVSRIPENAITKIDQELIHKYHPGHKAKETEIEKEKQGK